MSAAKTRSSAPPSGDRAEADAIARGVLDRLVLPPGSRRLAAAPARLSPGPPAPWSVDLHLQVRLAVPLRAGLGFLLTHLPAGLHQDGNGSLGDYEGGLVYFYTATQRVLPPGVSSVQLQETAQDGRGGAVVRFDAQVFWDPARPAADFLDPAAMTSVTAHVVQYGSATVRSFTRRISSPTGIGQIARLVDSLVGSEPGAYVGCPREGIADQLDVPAADGRPELQVSTYGCDVDVIETAGQARFFLADPGNRLSALIARLVHVGI